MLKLLTPHIFTKEEKEENQIYFDAIKKAIEDPSVKNFAITGAYGTGKSTIIHSFFHHYPPKDNNDKHAIVSLASFCEEPQINHSKQANTIDSEPLTQQKTKEEVEYKKTTELEVNILQQLFYQIDPKLLRFSRFQSKTNIDLTHMWKAYLLSILSILAIIYFGIKGNLSSYYSIVKSNLLFNSTSENWLYIVLTIALSYFFSTNLVTTSLTHLWNSKALKNNRTHFVLLLNIIIISIIGTIYTLNYRIEPYTMLLWLRKAILLMSPFVILGISFFFIFRCLYYGIYKGNFKKLQLNLGKIQSEHQISGSIIDENLHDIMVLFHSANLDVVVFEDIDRLPNAITLFTKLRELNKNINDSFEFKRKNKKVTFFYALKDDIITDPETRAKLFDLNISIVPFSTGTGSINQIYNNVQSNEFKIDHTLLDRVLHSSLENKEKNILNYSDPVIFPIDTRVLIILSPLFSDYRTIKGLLNDFTLYWHKQIRPQWNQHLVNKLSLLKQIPSYNREENGENDIPYDATYLNRDYFNITHHGESIEISAENVNTVIESFGLSIDDPSSMIKSNDDLKIVSESLLNESFDIRDKTNELFSLMVFKTLFAQQFANIHKIDSMLHYIFNEGKDAIIEYAESEIDYLKKQVQFSIETEPSNSIEELIIDYDSNKFPKGMRKYLNSDSVQISKDAIIKEKKFSLPNEQIEKSENSIKDVIQNKAQYNVVAFMSELLAEDDFNIRHKHMRIKEKYSHLLNEKKFNFTLKNRSLQEIHNKLKEFEIPFSWEILLGEYHNTISQKQFKYLQLLLLDENLITKRYLSIISENNKILAESDSLFLNQLYTNTPVSPYYAIINAKLLVQFISKEQFSAIQMINIDIISYLVAHSHESTNKTNNKEIVEKYIASTIIKNENEEWLQEFYMNLLQELTIDNRYDHSFKQHCIIVPILNNKQSRLFDKLLSNYKTQSRFIAYLFKDNDLAESISIKHPKPEKRSKLQDVLENEMDQFYLLNFDDQQLHNFINWANNDHISLKFKNCIYMTDLMIIKDYDTPRKIMKAVYENNLYRINSKMIKTMILFNNHISKAKYEFDYLQRRNKDEFIEELIPTEHWEQDKYQGAFENSNYEFILSLKDKPVNQKLINYIHSNITKYTSWEVLEGFPIQNYTNPENLLFLLKSVMNESENKESSLGILVNNSCYIPNDQLDFLDNYRERYNELWLKHNGYPEDTNYDDLELK
ncbi:hypothetical protein K5X82_04270 [Halosquirtibacter xylanolyticus]|uniref:YobI family P-loop NTPase n=1 Tax=Halosquirtibacter xylanolyticus TaxID=3374599 RepID=UPI003747D54F|nr:hypothetical protein K5X82_04270 [Prolixibacteraceae bacterium]